MREKRNATDANDVEDYTCLRPLLFKPINARASNFYAGILRTLWFDGLRNVNADSPNATGEGGRAPLRPEADREINCGPKPVG